MTSPPAVVGQFAGCVDLLSVTHVVTSGAAWAEPAEEVLVAEGVSMAAIRPFGSETMQVASAIAAGDAAIAAAAITAAGREWFDMAVILLSVFGTNMPEVTSRL